VTSLNAVRNSSKCNDIELKLEVKDERGAVVSSVGDFWLRSGHVKLIDLASIDSPSAGPWSFGPGTKGSGHSGVPGFVGAGVVEVTDVQQLCDTDGDGDVDQEPIMPSLVVVNKDTGPGDVTSVYEGIPVNRPSHLIGSQQRSHQDCSGGLLAFIRHGCWLEVKGRAKVGNTNGSSRQGATSRGFVVSLRPELRPRAQPTAGSG